MAYYTEMLFPCFVEHVRSTVRDAILVPAVQVSDGEEARLRLVPVAIS